jgi:hypothetical protein
MSTCKWRGAGVSSIHLLASDTSDCTCHWVRCKGGKEAAVLLAGSNARTSCAAARVKNQSAADSSSSPSTAVPKEVVTRLYKYGRLILTAPTNSKLSVLLCNGQTLQQR